jgi:hypothetical protein
MLQVKTIHFPNVADSGSMIKQIDGMTPPEHLG